MKKERKKEKRKERKKGQNKIKIYTFDFSELMEIFFMEWKMNSFVRFCIPLLCFL